MISEQEKIARITNALKFHSKGMSISEISKQLRINRNSVAKYLEILRISGKVEATSHGPSKIYTLSRRMPLFAMMGLTSDMILVLDDQGRVQDVNDAFLNFFGFQRTHITGKPLLFAEPSLFSSTPIMQILTENGERAMQIIERPYTRNGIISYLRLKLIPTSFDDGSNGLTIIIEDISESTRAVSELQKSEELYRGVLENIQDVYYRSDNDGTLIMASPSWKFILGYSSVEECLGRNIATDFYMEPEKRQEFLSEIKKKGSVTDYEVTLKRKDGTPLYVSTNSHLYYGKDGGILGVEGIFRDITERKAAAQEIRHYIHQIEFLSEKVLGFIGLNSSENIFDRIASDLRVLAPGSIILVNSFDPVAGTVSVQSLIIHDEGRQLITDTLGGDLVGRKFPIDTIWLTSFRAGTLYHARLPLYEIAFRAIPEPVCQMLESALSIGDMMSIGFVSGSEILGNATILLRSSSPVPDTHLIEMYAQQASIALQRHHADEARKKSDEIFVNLAYNSPLPISLIEADGTYTFVNRSFVRLFGYDLNDFHNGREWFLLAFPESDYRRNVIASWKSDLERFGSGESRTRTYYVQCKDSVRREIVFRPVTLSDGKQCVLYEDITDQQKAQHEHRLLSWIVDSTDDAIIGKDSGGTIISWNRAAENLYGYSPGEIIGRHISLIIPPQKRDEMERIFEQIRQGDTVNSLATKRVRKDGTVIDVVVTISPIKADDGSYIGASTIAREISRGFKDPRNSNSYQGLKEITSLAYLTNALRCAPDGIAILDLSARCLWVNDSLAALVGSEGSDFLVGKSAAKFIATEQRKTVLDRLTEVRKKGHALFPLVLLSPYGRVMVDASISVVADDKGNPAGYLAIIRIMEKLPNHTTPPGKDKKKKR